MKNMLSLHEAIVIALINIDKKNFSATFAEIADYIENRNLYPERKGGVELSKQVMLRSTKSKGAYHYLFTQIDSETIQLRDPLAGYKKEKKPIAKPKKGEEVVY